MRIGSREIGIFDIVAGGTVVALIGAIAFSFPEMQRNGKEAERERVRISGLCQQVMKGFDVNKDRVLQTEEGVTMARALGYNRVLPTDQLIFQLESCPKGEYAAYLRISNQGGNNGGIFGDRPVFDEYHWVTLPALESASRSQ